MDEISAQEFGRLQGQVESLTVLVQELRIEVKEISATLNNARGGWKTTMFFGGIAMSCGALLVKFLPLFSSAMPK